MNTSTTANRGRELLEQMAKIPVIVQGTLSERRSGDKVTGYKLQRWRRGRNQTRHIAAGLVDTVREGTEGYEQFMDLAQQYVEEREADALHSAPAQGKKKSTKR